MKTLLAAIVLSFCAGAAAATMFASRPAPAAPAVIASTATTARIYPAAATQAGGCFETVAGEQNCQ